MSRYCNPGGATRAVCGHTRHPMTPFLSKLRVNTPFLPRRFEAIAKEGHSPPVPVPVFPPFDQVTGRMCNGGRRHRLGTDSDTHTTHNCNIVPLQSTNLPPLEFSPQVKGATPSETPFLGFLCPCPIESPPGLSPLLAPRPPILGPSKALARPARPPGGGQGVVGYRFTYFTY